LLVPYTAVTTNPDTGKTTVTIINANWDQESREIEVGNTDGENYEVISGLQAGDKVSEIEYNPEKFQKWDFFDEEFE
jgi:multidrug efflux pump subunit AcrA (membrane-fusion protein)